MVRDIGKDSPCISSLPRRNTHDGTVSSWAGGREWHGIRIKKTPKIETMPFPYDISSTCQPQYESEWLAIKRRVKHL